MLGLHVPLLGSNITSYGLLERDSEAQYFQGHMLLIFFHSIICLKLCHILLLLCIWITTFSYSLGLTDISHRHLSSSLPSFFLSFLPQKNMSSFQP